MAEGQGRSLFCGATELMGSFGRLNCVVSLNSYRNKKFSSNVTSVQQRMHSVNVIFCKHGLIILEMTSDNVMAPSPPSSPSAKVSDQIVTNNSNSSLSILLL